MSTITSNSEKQTLLRIFLNNRLYDFKYFA